MGRQEKERKFILNIGYVSLFRVIHGRGTHVPRRVLLFVVRSASLGLVWNFSPLLATILRFIFHTILL